MHILARSLEYDDEMDHILTPEPEPDPTEILMDRYLLFMKKVTVESINLIIIQYLQRFNCQYAFRLIGQKQQSNANQKTWN